VDGSGKRRLTVANASAFAYPVWSPDGRRIAYGTDCVSGPGGDRYCALAVVAADGSGKRILVAAHAAFAFGFRGEWWWGGKNTLLVWEGRRGNFSVDASTGDATLVPADRGAFPMAVGAGHTVGFLTSDRAGNRFSIVVTTLDGRVLDRQLLPRGTRGSGVLWLH